MTKEAIRNHVTAVQFQPFFMRLTDGRSYVVPGPDYASVSPTPNGRSMAIYTDYTDVGNGVRILDMAIIVEIETTETS